MTLHFLEALPREIRDQIYIYVLAGPSGLVNFSPWTFDVARSLSLLKTCKQIHRECKDIIWQHNGLHPRTPSELFLKFQELERFRFMQYFRHIDRLQHLTICLELLDWDELQWISQALKELEIWKPRRRFESIKLITVRDRPRDIAEFKDVVRLRMDGELVDGRQYFNCSTSFDHIVVDTCWPKFSPWGKQRLLREMLLDTGDPSELLRDIHNAYGGELYIDGVLCFADYIQVVDAIQLDPRDGEINICPKNIGTGG